MKPEFLLALVGGLCIGLASFAASAASGKIPGISGVFSKVFLAKPGDTQWRLLFLLGLVGGAGLVFALGPSGFTPVAPLWLMAFSGFIVGIGTRLGGGCTSGHGVCGMGLGSKDSMVATVIFMGTGVATVFVVRHLIGGLG